MLLAADVADLPLLRHAAIDFDADAIIDTADISPPYAAIYADDMPLMPAPLFRHYASR